VWQRLRHDERGGATIVLFPLFAVVTFAFIRAISWRHDRQLANSAADQPRRGRPVRTAPSSAEAGATASSNGRDGQRHRVDQPGTTTSPSWRSTVTPGSIGASAHIQCPFGDDGTVRLAMRRLVRRTRRR
jgi:hypothetical protein